jgi:uncharacterized protein (TIGR03437 family)
LADGLTNFDSNNGIIKSGGTSGTTGYVSAVWQGLSPTIAGPTTQLTATFKFTIPATAVGGQTYTVNWGSQPASASFNGNAVTTTEGSAQVVTVPSILTISTPATGATLPAATVGVPYLPGGNPETVTATGGTAPYTSFSLTAGSLPNGMSVTGPNAGGQGVVGGTPTTAAGSPYSLTVTVKDTANGTASAIYSLPVNPAITAVLPATLPNGTEGAAYASGTISVTGGTPPYTFTTTANLSGIGLSLSPVSPATGNTATITGTPTSGETNLSVPVKVTDANGATFTQNYTLTIAGLSITAPVGPALPNGTINLIYNGPNGVSFTSSGGTAPITWSVTTGTPPPGLSLSGAGVLSGTPNASITQATTSTFTVTATDAHSITASAQYSITVYPQVMLSGPAALPIGTVGSAYTTLNTTLTATGGAPNLKYTATGLPNNLTINSGTGIISGTPASGTNTPSGTPDNITITVTDGDGETAQVTATLTVDPALVITTASPLPAATSGGPYTTTVAGSGGSGTGYAWTATNLPAGLSIASATGVISGTNVTGATAANVSITLTDSTSSSISKTFSITVNPALTITTNSLPAATLNGNYSTTVKSSGGTGAVTWAATGLPTGLSMASGTGIISGTPSTNASSPYSVAITATDANNATANATLNLTVNNALTVTGPATLPTATAGSAYTSGNNITISGGTAPVTVALSGLPANFGLTVSNTGVITGTPATNTGQPFTVKVTATDANTSSNQSFTLPVNPALTLSVSPQGSSASNLAVAIPAVAYKETFTPGGGSGNGYTVTAAGLTGTGLSFNAGVISGTPLASATGNHTVTMTVTDSNNATANFTYTLTIAPPLSINTTGTPPAGILAASYAGFTVTATGGTPPYGWSASGLPPGLTIGATTGTITGTPTAVVGSPFTATVTVTDANGTTAKATYTISISALPLQFITGILPAGVVGAPYTYTSIRVQGGAGNYTWTITGLPPGLSTDGNGNIFGTPTTATGSPFTVTVKVTDATQTSLTTTYSLVINNVLTVALPAALPGATLNAAYAPITVMAGGGLPPYTWAATGLPTGMSINIATGVISGTPTTAAGSPYSVTVTVTDSTGKTATMNYSLAVASVLSITGPATLPVATLGGAYPSTTITAAGGSPAYTWSATGLPTGLSIGSSTGTISGTPAGGTAGTANVTVTVSDTVGGTATKNYTITVNPAPGAPVITSVSAATEGQGFIAPNTWISVYGTNFTTPNFTDTWTNTIKGSSTGALPTILDNVSVSVGGQMAYVYFLSATQINVLTPNIGFGPLAVTVTNVNGTSNAVMITSQADIPGFFVWPNAAGQTPGDSSQQPVATHPDYSDAAANGTFTTATVPAKPGETIILWGSGFGTTSPNNPFGVAVPIAGGPFVTTGTVSVQLNGAPVTVYNNSAVLAPGNAGLFQLGVTIPSTLANGTYPINVTVNGVTSPTLSLTVHN